MKNVTPIEYLENFAPCVQGIYDISLAQKIPAFIIVGIPRQMDKMSVQAIGSGEEFNATRETITKIMYATGQFITVLHVFELWLAEGEAAGDKTLPASQCPGREDGLGVSLIAPSGGMEALAIFRIKDGSKLEKVTVVDGAAMINQKEYADPNRKIH